VGAGERGRQGCRVSQVPRQGDHGKIVSRARIVQGYIGALSAGQCRARRPAARRCPGHQSVFLSSIRNNSEAISERADET